MKSRRLRIGTSRAQFALPMIFTLVIAMISAADMFYWGELYKHTPLWEILSLFGGYLLLMLLDLVDLLVFPHRMHNALLSLFFLLRFAVIVFVQWLDPAYSSLSLLALIPYYTFFTYGGVISVIFTMGLLGYYYLLLGQIGAEITAGVANLIFLQIISFIMGHTQRATLRNRELLEELHRTNTEMELMAEEVAELSAVEERMRLSRDLHDSIGHYLTAISIQLQKALAYKDISAEDSLGAVQNAQNSASEALTEVRSFINTLKDRRDTFSLGEKLQPLVDNLRQDGLTIETEITGEEEKYPLPIRRNLYYSLQELLTNIQKHAHASEVKVKVQYKRREATLMVEDNGEGFSPERASRKEGHFGLKHLKQRAEAMDGRMHIKSKKGKGTQGEICVPWRAIEDE